MKILLTGASGFLGSIIAKEFDANNLITVGRNNTTVICDISKEVPSLPVASMVIHTAGKAHMVPKTAAEKQVFYDVNVIGTKNLLTALENNPILPKSFVFISTVAVYGLEIGHMIKEDSPLLATEPYGQSKIQAEQLVQQWCEKHSVICTILRLPLIAGPNPPGNLGAMVNGIKKGYYFNVAGGGARKSVVLAYDVARIIPEVSTIGGIYNLTDGHHPSFAELAKLISKQLGKRESSNIPSWLAVLIGKAGDILGKKAPLNTNKLNKMITDLTFNDSKAAQVLRWKPTPVLKGFKIK